MFWLLLARSNGLIGLEWRDSRPKQADIDECMDGAIKSKVIHLLDCHPDGGTNPRPAQHHYFTDCGIARRLLDFWVDRERNRRVVDKQGAAIDARLDKIVRQVLARNFEGLVVTALRPIVKPNGRLWVWRRDDDEIDVLIEWRENTFTAVEITTGALGKKPKEGFSTGCKHFGIPLAGRYVVSSQLTESSRIRAKSGVTAVSLDLLLEDVRDRAR